MATAKRTPVSRSRTKVRKAKAKQTFKVYCTYFPNGEYYIGFSGKMGKAYDEYYGSGRNVLEYTKGDLEKETIAEYDKKSHGKICEFLLQWKYRHDDKCLNQMINIRLNLRHLQDFKEVRWKPKGHSKYANND